MPSGSTTTKLKSNWKTTTFKKGCAGLGYRINRCSGHIQAVLELKFLHDLPMNGSVGTTRMGMYQQKDNLLVIQGSTFGLKRIKKTEPLDYHFS